ncbi:MAG: radical SAM protein [Candidatus Omnitrophota bacterium]|nr:MAG: radical SAM protein [Candidatus Omnitrophota bacterium]
MAVKKFKYIYGPVPSWRLGESLGIDLLSGKNKPCSFDCIYCQLGKTYPRTLKRKLYVPTEKIIEEIKALPDIHIDYITFSGRGEATLASNLGEAIKALRRLRREPIAVLTNACLLNDKKVREELALADLVALKLDAPSQGLLNSINQPARRVKFAAILEGIKEFRKEYRGKLALQIMFVRGNASFAEDIAKLARDIRPDEVQINTPRRRSPVKPLSRSAILKIKKAFSGMNVISVYDAKHKKTRPLSAKDTRRRRGKTL